VPGEQTEAARSAPADAALYFRLAMDAVLLGTWSCTLPTGPVLLDRKAGAMLGLAPDERLPVRDLLAAFQPEDREVLGRAIAGAAHRGGFTLEARLGPAAHRDPIRVRLVAGLAPGVAGGASRLLGVIAPLRRRQDGAGEATQLAAIVASSDDAIIGKTVDGIVTSWNRAAERIFGYDEAEMLGQPIGVLAPPGYEDEMPAILARIRQGGRVEHYETFRRHKDGRLVRVSLSVSPIHNEAGELVGASKVARDITAAHRATEALRGAEARLAAVQEELEQVSRLGALGQMAAMLAHEVNQPLTAIVNYARAAQRLLTAGGETALARAGEAMGHAAKQAARAGQTIRGLRAFAGGDAVHRRAEQLGPILEEAVRLTAGHSEQRGVHVRLDLAPDCPPVMADRLLIRQVALNLMRNAAEAMERLARREMTVSTRCEGDSVEVAVSDTGPGLAPEVAARLFQPFVTTKPDAAGGGLAICRSIVEAHGGHLWTEENPEGGTTFRFTVQTATE
jgi:two-component system, LuxR family, sensor kinase FixL